MENLETLLFLSVANFHAALVIFRLSVVDVTKDHALVVYSLPRHHSNPFDRMIVAQAQLEDLAVATLLGGETILANRLLALALPSSSGELLVEDRYAHVKCLNALSDAKFQDIHDFVDRCSVCERGLDMAARTLRVHVRNRRVQSDA